MNSNKWVIIWVIMFPSQSQYFEGSVDCFMQVCKNEEFMSSMKEAGANILRGVVGAGVLAGFKKLKALYIEFRTSQ